MTFWDINPGSTENLLKKLAKSENCAQSKPVLLYNLDILTKIC